MHRLFRLCIATVFSAFILAGCDAGGDKDLPIETREWVTPGDGYYQFYTNDPQYYGYVFWYPLVNDDPAAVFSGFRGIAKKMQGDPSYGYGFFFCYADRDNYYRLLINEYGYYQVTKQVADVWTAIVPWEYSPYLIRGARAENIVAVTRTEEGHFSVTFNGKPGPSFDDVDLTVDGFAAVACIGMEEDEDFPNEPVDVRIKFTSPAALPAARIQSASSSSMGWAEAAGSAPDAAATPAP